MRAWGRHLSYVVEKVFETVRFSSLTAAQANFELFVKHCNFWREWLQAIEVPTTRLLRLLFLGERERKSVKYQIVQSYLVQSCQVRQYGRFRVRSSVGTGSARLCRSGIKHLRWRCSRPRISREYTAFPYVVVVDGRHEWESLNWKVHTERH